MSGMNLRKRILPGLLGLGLLSSGVAAAQVGQTLDTLLKNPQLAQAKRNAAGIVTLPDGASILLRQRGDYLIGATVIVSNAAPAALTVTGGTGASTGSAVTGGAGAAGTPVTTSAAAITGSARAAALVGLLSGYGDGMAQPLTAFLTRADVVPRLPDGVTITALPYQLKAQTKGKVLSVEVTLARVPDNAFTNTTNALPARKRGAVPLVVRVYSDFQCPYCLQFETQTLPALVKDLPEDVRIEFHQLPLEGIHPLARASAEASECAAQQGQFWAYKDALFADRKWLTGNPNLGFIALADGLKLNVDTFKTCLAERGGKAAVDAGLEEANKLQLNSTPTVFVNGYRAGNPYDAAALLNLIRFARVADSAGGTTPAKP